MSQQDINQQKVDIIVLGASGHAKVVIDLIEKQEQFQIIGLIDDDPTLNGQEIYGYKVLGDKEELENQSCKQCVIAIGDNQVRNDLEYWLEINGFVLVKSISHPSSQLARGVSIGNGSVVMAGSVVNSDTNIARNTIINTGATIDHDCNIGNDVVISKARGQWFQKEIGMVKPWIIASFHPAFLMRQPEQKKLAWIDLKMIRDKSKILKI